MNSQLDPFAANPSPVTVDLSLRPQGVPSSRPLGPRTRFDELMFCVGESMALIKELECRELDRRALTEEPSHEASSPLITGDVVVMLGNRMGGRFTDRDASRVWTVVACDCDLCALGRHVAVDQPFDLGRRHIARAALRRQSQASSAEGESFLETLTSSEAAGRFMGWFAGEGDKPRRKRR